ncbi:MAG: hypothetical protein U5K69_06945 [Balneolaceae bacterium]|nr:hypothetical protein [Balneolaceae bacterium]
MGDQTGQMTVKFGIIQLAAHKGQPGRGGERRRGQFNLEIHEFCGYLSGFT